MKKMTFAVVCCFLLGLVAHAQAVQLPKTGQTICYNAAGAVIDCPGTG